MERLTASVAELVESNARLSASVSAALEEMRSVARLAQSGRDDARAAGHDMITKLESLEAQLRDGDAALRDELQLLSDASFAVRCTALRDLESDGAISIPERSEVILHGPMEKVGGMVYMHRRTFDEKGDPLRDRVPVEIDGSATVSMAPY